MFLRSTALVYPHLHLLTFGETCRYVIAEGSTNLTITDPGLSCHVALLPQRLIRVGLEPNSIKNVILTNLDPDRVAGIPALRRSAPQLKVFGTTSMRRFLENTENVKKIYDFDKLLSATLRLNIALPDLTFEEFKAGLVIDQIVKESDVIEAGEELTLRVVLTPGHRDHSVSYLLLPHEFILGDQTFGYFNGNKLASPGGDFDLLAACNSIAKFSDFELSGIGLPYGGALTGELVKKHLESVVQNTHDLHTAVKEAITSGVPSEEIVTQVKDGFFNGGTRDPIYLSALTATEKAVWAQVTTNLG